jgi:glycosyltransferase involved in cell wall biosynthesis
MTQIKGLPLVSVCIPAYNAAATLGETLESILAQDYPRIEIVVSDNHSTDGTRAVVGRYASRGVRYCLNPLGRPAWAAQYPGFVGIYANWDYALSQGKGDFLCLFHSDDLYEPNIISSEVRLMSSHSEMGAVFTMMRRIGENGGPIRRGSTSLPPELKNREVFRFKELFDATLKHHNILPTPSVMLRRSVWENAGGFNEKSFLTSADLEMWLRIAEQYPIGIINSPLLNYRISQRQGAAKYNKRRTTLGDFFLVIDYYLSRPEMRKFAAEGSIRIYEMERHVGLLFCVMNMLAEGRSAEAATLLRTKRRRSHFITAIRSPKRFTHLIIGELLSLFRLLRIDTFAGRCLYRFYQFVERKRRQNIR